MPLFPLVGRRQPGIRFAWWLVIAILCFGIFMHLVPFYFMLITSVKTGYETLANPPTFWPQKPTLVAWTLVFQTVQGSNLLPLPFFRYFFNSLFMAGMTMLLSLPITSLAAYANSKLIRGPLGRWMFIFLIGTLMIPGVVKLLPTLLMTLHFPFAVPEGSIPTLPGTEEPFPTMRIWDTPWAIIIPAIYSAGAYLFFKGYFDTIPNSVIQAARVDGGSEFNIFRRIVLPMSIPVYAVVAWSEFSMIWDGNFLWVSLAIQSEENIPTSLAIYKLMEAFQEQGVTSPLQAQHQQQLIEAGLSWNGLIVLGILQTIPIFLMFIVCREYLLKGIRIRGLK